MIKLIFSLIIILYFFYIISCSEYQNQNSSNQNYLEALKDNIPPPNKNVDIKKCKRHTFFIQTSI